MRDIVVESVGLGKRYRIGEREQYRYRTLRDIFTETLYAPARCLRGLLRPSAKSVGSEPDTTFWALRDVSLEVRRGEVVGVVGRNGAGKSTLLKILSRITKPTEGRVRVRGRVGSLLEVGTGFHPELTGRENVYLNGAILGMRKAEIDHKFDEIVAFAEVERFIDTPVKRYSSGMHVRLAFAVAAHLEPEILIVDEVLAVGDAAFQQKCLGKMGTVAKGGRTIVFVSHQMNQIRRLCDQCIWLDEGRVRKVGSTADVIGSYETSMATPGPWERAERDLSSHRAGFVGWEIVSVNGSPRYVLTTTGPMTIRFVARIMKRMDAAHHGVLLLSNDNQVVWSAAADRLKLEAGVREFTYHFSGLPLRPGLYRWFVSLFDDGEQIDEWLCFPGMVIATRPGGHPTEHLQGILNLEAEFRVG
jgi:lipopolysaccharide transport system ATP-binding protein